MSIYGISFKNNPEQQELIRLIMENNRQIIFCTGNAGTGKTFASIAAALHLQAEKKYRKIFYARNPVQVGHDMGFLPGGIDEKYSPFMAPLYDNLDSIAAISANKPNPKNMAAQIEVVPIAFMRGRNFDDAIVIIDEAQNLTANDLRTIMTRMGKFSKLILLGSMNQIDNQQMKRQHKCDFQKVMEAFVDKPYCGYVTLTQSMRSPICVDIDETFNTLEK